MTRTLPEAVGLSNAKRELLARLLQEQQRTGSQCRLEHTPGADLTALSFVQERLWFLSQIEPGLPTYNFVRAWRTNGSLDLDALERALTMLVERHESLRAVFPGVEGRPITRLLPPVRVQLQVVDLSDTADEHRVSEARQLVKEVTERAFDLAAGPLFRAGVVRLDERDHIVYVVTHHIVFDGWSAGVFERELAVFYNSCAAGESRTLPPLPLRYADFIHWQRKRFEGEEAATLRAYWKKQLDGIPDVLSLPADRARTAQPTSHGARYTSTLSPQIIEGLKSFSREHGVTLFMSLLAAFQGLLHRYTGEIDIVVGSPAANRQAAELEHLVGFFANMLPLRTRFDGDPTFAELVVRVRQTSLDAYAHQDMPFEKLVDELRPRRSLQHSPIFQVAFSLQHWATPSLSGLTVVPFAIPRDRSKFDLTLALLDTPSRMTATYEYRTDLFSAQTIGRMATHFEALLERILRDPHQRLSAFPLVTAAEQNAIVNGFNPEPAEFSNDRCVHQSFEDQVRKNPDATAVTVGSNRLSYDMLNRRANRLAHFLVTAGCRPGDVVGVGLERGAEFVIALIAVLKAGAAYLPVDPAQPSERLLLMLEKAGTRLCVTEHRFRERLQHPAIRAIALDSDGPAIRAESAEDLPARATPSDLAYVIYTSGSTGVPRGVAVSHHAVVARVIDVDYVTLSSSDVVSQTSSTSFDVAAFEIWGALLNGARLDVISKPVLLSPALLEKHIAEQGITTLFLTTALFNRVADQRPSAFAGVRQLLFAGEAADPGAVRKVLNAGRPAKLINVYGPTEATIFASWYPVESVDPEDTTIPIGRPISRTRIHILDRHLNPMPVGVTGEIHIGGPGVARGYLNEPRLTDEKFIRDPFAAKTGSRLYRSGDLARYRSDGNIEFLGRIDDQIKLRGFRIEPGEIEAILRTHPGVRWASVMVHTDGAGEKRLVAYLTGDRVEDGGAELRGLVAGRLPDYMVPSAFVWIDAIPLTANGKLDRAALPAPAQPNPDSGRAFAPPRDAFERQLAAVWEEVLGTGPIGLHDNFFELGGHSLLAVVLMSRIEKICDIPLTPAVLFEAPTLGQLASQLRSTSARPSSPLVAIQPDGTLPPLFCIHGMGGNVVGYADLARHLGRDQPVYGLEAVGLDANRTPHTSLEEMAACYVAEIRQLQPRGPYYLCGLSMGGVIAYEMAQQLHDQGERTALLAMFDTNRPGSSRVLPRRLRLVNAARRASYHAQRLSGHERRAHIERTARTLRRRLRERIWHLLYLPYKASGSALPRLLHHVRLANRTAAKTYTPRPYAGRVTVFRARERSIRLHSAPDLGWGGYAAGGVKVFEVEGNHVSLIQEPAVAMVAAQLRRALEQARGSSEEEDV